MIARILREYRTKMGYTQKDVADVLGIDRSTYAYYETGKTEVPVKKLAVLARLYGVEINDFFNNDALVLNDPDKEKKHKTEVGMLSKEEKQLLAKVRLLDSSAKRLELYRFLEELNKENDDK
ncbi:MAG: helix-turn-helix transcriptional regulator [Clostridia bacterium]|nr:helix-turn-helix transcriptional regulator [Clostridia bacterium]